LKRQLLWKKVSIKAPSIDSGHLNEENYCKNRMIPLIHFLGL